VAYCARHQVNVKLLEIDDSLVTEYLSAYPEAAAGDQELLTSAGGLSFLLTRPKEILRRLWRDVVTARLQAATDTCDYLFLSLHASFFNNQSREFFSPIQAEHLREQLSAQGFSVKCVVTLIDDIDDIYRHLSRENQLFQLTSSGDSHQRAVEAMLNFRLALDWRSLEIVQADMLARSLACRHVILAVKHDLTVAYQALLLDRPMAYVSHPISDVRQDQRFVSEVQDLTGHLTTSDVVVPISPTAIDELRVERSTENNRVFRPSLFDRWPFGRPNEVLFIPPQEESMNPLDPDASFGDSDDAFLGGMLHNLVEAIRSQINARDRALVEQSTMIVVWRPCYTGEMSSGVFEEITHRNSLIDHRLIAEGEKPCFVYTPLEDLGKWRIVQLLHRLRREAQTSSGVGLDESLIMRLRSALAGDSHLVRDIAEGKATHQTVQQRVNSIAPGIQVGTVRLGALSGTPMVMAATAANEWWRQTMGSVFASAPLEGLLRGHDVLISQEMTVEEFVSVISNQRRGQS